MLSSLSQQVVPRHSDAHKLFTLVTRSYPYFSTEILKLHDDGRWGIKGCQESFNSPPSFVRSIIASNEILARSKNPVALRQLYDSLYALAHKTYQESASLGQRTDGEATPLLERVKVVSQGDCAALHLIRELVKINWRMNEIHSQRNNCGGWCQTGVVLGVLFNHLCAVVGPDELSAARFALSDY